MDFSFTVTNLESFLQTISAIAVVTGMILVVLQLRLNAKQARSSNAFELIGKVIDPSFAGNQPAWAGIHLLAKLQLACKGEPEMDAGTSVAQRRSQNSGWRGARKAGMNLRACLAPPMLFVGHRPQRLGLEARA